MLICSGIIIVPIANTKFPTLRPTRWIALTFLFWTWLSEAIKGGNYCLSTHCSQRQGQLILRNLVPRPRGCLLGTSHRPWPIVWIWTTSCLLKATSHHIFGSLSVYDIIICWSYWQEIQELPIYCSSVSHCPSGSEQSHGVIYISNLTISITFNECKLGDIQLKLKHTVHSTH